MFILFYARVFYYSIAIFKIKADIRMNKTTLNSQKEKHSMLSLRRATPEALCFAIITPGKVTFPCKMLQSF